MRAPLALILSLAVPAGAGGIESKVRKFAAAPALRTAQWGVCAAYADSGREAAAWNADASLAPGSSLKLLVTGAALSVLGAEHRFETAVSLSGRVSAGTLKGDVVIRGGGDPSLGSTLVRGGRPMEDVFAEWAAALSAKGVKAVQGDIVADNGAFTGSPIPGSWPWEDTGNYYAAPADALSINDNLFRLVFAPGSKPGADAALLRLEPPVPGLEFANFMKTGPEGSGDNGYVYNVPGGYKAVLRGTVPAGPAEFAIKGAIPEPALFAAQAFLEHCRKAGIKVSGKARLAPAAYAGPAGGVAPGARTAEPGLETVWTTKSVPLRDIVRLTNKRSFNLYAEMLARAVAARLGKPASVEGAAEALREFLASAGVDASGVRIFDACGLSRLNTIGARAMTQFLVRMSKSGVFADYEASLPFPGDPEGFGHIKGFGKGTVLEKSLRIKSGSLNGVRAYSGYLRNKTGRLLAFAFIVNNYSCSPAEIEKIHEDLILALAESK